MDACGVCIFVHSMECGYAYRRRLRCRSCCMGYQNLSKENDNGGLRFFVSICQQ